MAVSRQFYLSPFTSSNLEMYSFYRAWLMHDAFQSTIGNPPDVLLQIGPTCTQFAAHRAILISHSGYFKSVFTSPTSTSPVLVPNIGVPEFTSLLTWMYTGYLDLNLENIYNILLATHLLHMPNALEICRNFLIQNNQIINNNSEANRALNQPSQQTASTSSTVTSTTIIKPIPSRKFLPETLRNFLPIIPTHLKTNENTSFHKIHTLARNDEPPQQEPSPRHEQQIERKTPEIIDLKKKSKTPEIVPDVIETTKIASPKPSTSFQFNNRSPNPRSPSSIGSLSPNLSDKSDAVVLDYPPPKSNTKTRKFKQQQSNFIKTPTIKSSDKVIIDIACCDGPVRFHRVLNNCYGLTQATTITTPTTTTTMKTTTSDLMNKIMTHEMNSRRNKKLNNDSTIEDSSSSTDIVYTCVYCNHTFKSQYCYQKHARRHINPVTLSSTCKISNNEPQQSNIVTRKNNFDSNSNHVLTNGGTNSTGSSVKREVKLLDMNVQYYPCKTCGSKFPSYYFVHKHRKMYHADEIEKEANAASGEATTQSQNGQEEDDIVMTTNKSMSSASSTSSVLSKEKSLGAPPPNKENDI